MGEKAVINSGQAFTERDGRELAVSLLRELRDTDADLTALEDDYRPAGRAQDNIVLRYLTTLRETENRALEAGFAAVLSDFIASTLNGAIPDPDHYEPAIEGAA